MYGHKLPRQVSGLCDVDHNWFLGQETRFRPPGEMSSSQKLLLVLRNRHESLLSVFGFSQLKAGLPQSREWQQACT